LKQHFCEIPIFESSNDNQWVNDAQTRVELSKPVVMYYDTGKRQT